MSTERMLVRLTTRKRGTLRHRCTCVAAIAATSLGAAAGYSQSLDTAQQSAFEQSFVLRSDKARQDGAEARLRGSLDAFMPSVYLLGSLPLDSRIRYSPDLPVVAVGPDATPRHQPNQYGIGLDLSLFDGLQRWNNLLSARSQAEAGRRLTIDARQQVVLDTASAYLSVIRDRKILAYRREQVASLLKIQRGIETRYSVRDATRTDVSLASSRVADARSAVDQASADLAASELEFVRLTRQPADRLGPVRLPTLPRTETELASLVLSQNPKLEAARLDARSAGYLAEAAKGALLPQVSLQFSHGRQTDITSTLNNITDTTTKVVAKIPIYEPGTIPKISEASAFARQKIFDTEDAALQTVTAARASFRRRISLQSGTDSLAKRVDALRSAVKGYEIERGAGFRTVIDELNTRAELASAQILLATAEAERDRLAFVLAACIGRLDGARSGPAPAEIAFRRPVDRLPVAALADAPAAPQRTAPQPLPPQRRMTDRSQPSGALDALRLRLGSAITAVAARF